MVFEFTPTGAEATRSKQQKQSPKQLRREGLRQLRIVERAYILALRNNTSGMQHDVIKRMFYVAAEYGIELDTYWHWMLALHEAVATESGSPTEQGAGHEKMESDERCMMDIDTLIQHEMQPQSFRWWGHEYTDIVPALVDKQLGDGQALMWFSSMDTRPRHWLIRVDSKVNRCDDGPMDQQVIEQVIDAIADQFGECECEDSCDCAFPILILDTGYSWGICGEDDLVSF